MFNIRLLMTNVFSYKLFKYLSSHQLHSLTLDFFSCNFFFRYFIGALKGKCVPLPNAVGSCYKKSSLNKSQPREKNEITMNELKMKQNYKRHMAILQQSGLNFAFAYFTYKAFVLRISV